LSEALDRYQMVSAGFDRVVKEVPADRWSAPSPCEGWTARDVVAHVVRNHRSMAAAATGIEAFEMSESDDPAAAATGIEAFEMSESDDPAAAWSDAYNHVRRLAEEPEAMAALVNGPGGQLPLDQALGSFVSMDTHVHTWDLAQAIGRDERLDPEMVRFIRAMLEPMGDAIRRPGVFGAEVEAPEGADEQARLLCYLGRRA
jgi:uncharacterized protein (TIGR03086 family)